MEKLTEEKIIKLQKAIEAGDVKIKWGYEMLSLLAEVHEGRRVVEIDKKAHLSLPNVATDWYWCPSCKEAETIPNKAKFCPNCRIALKWKD